MMLLRHLKLSCYTGESQLLSLYWDNDMMYEDFIQVECVDEDEVDLDYERMNNDDSGWDEVLDRRAN
jgi:hypothetical protein